VCDPILKPLHRLIVSLRNFRFDVGVISFGNRTTVDCCD